MKRSWDFCH